MTRQHAWFQQLRYIQPALGLVWTAAKRWTIAWALLMLLQSVLPVFAVYLIRDLVNSAAVLIQQGWESSALQHIMLLIVLVAAIQILTELSSSAIEWVRTVQSEVVRDYISGLIQEKATALDLSYFETPEYYDLLHRVRSEARQRPLSLLEGLGSVVTSGLTLIGMMAILISYSVLLPLVLIVSTLPALWVVVRYSQRHNQWRVKNTVNERRSIYYDFVLTEAASAAEVRLFSLGDHYRRAYAILRSRLRNERFKIAADKLLSDFFATVIGLLVAGSTLLWMGWRVVAGSATFGDLAAFYQIFQQGQSLMRVLMRNTGIIYQSVLFVGDLFDFLALQPKLVSVPTETNVQLTLKEAIRFENVTFQYPGGASYALKNFSMTIPAGKIVAIVGENGMGKTTLMKLLCRFYDPNEGRILWDGIDVRELPISALQSAITMMFQVPYCYPETAYHNIAVGDLSANPSASEIEAAARAAGADELISRLPQGYGTILGKWFGGQELSVGQWQRICLARAFLRNASVVILDEPTSAMDAWAEMDWLSRVRNVTNNRTLIMITHRFTTAMQADHIYVMHNQQIIQEGTHKSLLRQGGRYADSWYEQMRQVERNASRTVP